jgi:60 kDa SS-A/Ro ribonucleoprotein
MARFNANAKVTHRDPSLNSEMELYTRVCTSLLSDKYYESASTELETLIQLVKVTDPVFVGNLAAYARNELHLRTISTVLTVLLCRYHPNTVGRATVKRTIQRADDITEALSFYSVINPDIKTINKGAHTLKKAVKNVPISLIRGIRDVFESGRFKEYHYAKYSGAGKAFSIRDALFLTHPNSTKGGGNRNELFKKIANRQLTPPDTWEVAFTRLGKATDGEKKSLWMELLNRGDLGHMALLRNLRNILQTKPTDYERAAILRALVDGVDKGKQLPFRYWSAYREISEAGLDPFMFRELETTLTTCLVRSFKHMPAFEGRSLFACDVSGSMNAPISKKTKIKRIDIGLLLGLLAHAHDPQSILGLFGTDFIIAQPSGNVLSDIRMGATAGNTVGHGTNGENIFRGLAHHKVALDNVVIFTDLQMNNEAAFTHAWERYKLASPTTKLWLVNTAGYGTTPVRIEGDVYMISGWNDRVFEMVNHLRKGTAALDVIRGYTGPVVKVKEKSINPADAWKMGFAPV